MRSLALNEMKIVSGGNVEDALAAGLILGLVGIGLAATTYPQGYSYDVVTPVFDPYGRYVGDQIDTYYVDDRYYGGYDYYYGPVYYY